MHINKHLFWWCCPTCTVSAIKWPFCRNEWINPNTDTSASFGIRSILLMIDSLFLSIMLLWQWKIYIKIHSEKCQSIFVLIATSISFIAYSTFNMQWTKSLYFLGLQKKEFQNPWKTERFVAKANDFGESKWCSGHQNVFRICKLVMINFISHDTLLSST